MSFFGFYLRFLPSYTLSYILVPKSFSWISKREPILRQPWEVPWRPHRIKTVIPKLLIQIAIRKHCSSSYPSILLCCCLLPVRRLAQCLLSREVSGRQPLTRMKRGGCDVRRAGRRGAARRPWHRSRACRVQHAEERQCTRSSARMSRLATRHYTYFLESWLTMEIRNTGCPKSKCVSFCKRNKERNVF